MRHADFLGLWELLEFFGPSWLVPGRAWAGCPLAGPGGALGWAKGLVKLSGPFGNYAKNTKKIINPKSQIQNAKCQIQSLSQMAQHTHCSMGLRNDVDLLKKMCV